ncbi:MAG TPA: SDR family NAD(P)-dependent oxidoreductase [Gemmataceae bacterium]|nr:SDR family NAD(P)-dependent oxidoreductase [Gemmataceae bacterium]
MSKTILVTGAAGFIGSHLCAALLQRGDQVVGLDSFNDYYSPERKRANIEEIRAKHFALLEGDVRDAALVNKVVAEHHLDAIVHLAAMAGVRASIRDPHLYHAVNVAGTLNLLDAIQQRPNINLVLASTSSVYGATERIPFVEDDPCDRPMSPYAASKRAAEILAYTYHHLYNLNVTALRFFTVYGPRNRPDMMAYKVVDNIFFGRDVPLYNHGHVFRDWTYVDDIVAGVIAAADRPLGYQIINLGRGEPVQLADFVACIEELTGRRANLAAAPLPDTDIISTHADISKARRLLGYAPQTSVPEGVERFWQWYWRHVLQLA